MLIDENLLDSLLEQAAESDRRRMNFDLRTSPDDGSQRMLNALLPGTTVPIHRHTGTSETVVLLRGAVTEIFFDENGTETSRYELDSSKSGYAVQIPKGQWHTIIANAPSVIFEAKDGPFSPALPEDLLTAAEASRNG